MNISNNSKQVEELIEQLKEIQEQLSKLDTSLMPDHAKGFVQGVLMGSGLCY